jgi:hypothetical protein
MIDSGFPALFSLFPDSPEKQAYLYSPCKILYVTLSLSFETKNKYIVLIDELDPPIFFLINSKKYGIFNKCCLEMRKERYDFLTNDVSYLNYMKIATTIDFIDGRYPTRQSLIDALNDNPSRVKGVLRIDDAEEILDGIKSKATDIEGRDKKRIITSFEKYIQAVKP